MKKELNDDIYQPIHVCSFFTIVLYKRLSFNGYFGLIVSFSKITSAGTFSVRVALFFLGYQDALDEISRKF
ncbi:hypothetical protein FZC79_14075 [Rossellomorea vietnamensis]|uniref:Uncharacterized protein n=1 Tax=Rossellomorea vietnamensis TaxID=218284 RepID=A0A5D4KBA6_9BACI|nr:hypothetical protein [Rossellomorea vietnamensis]TYR74598.1 hypothetical protein FZC79_14075 [Rossellomorea vietnamensis]